MAFSQFKDTRRNNLVEQTTGHRGFNITEASATRRVNEQQRSPVDRAVSLRDALTYISSESSLVHQLWEAKLVNLNQYQSTVLDHRTNQPITFTYNAQENSWISHLYNEQGRPVVEARVHPQLGELTVRYEGQMGNWGDVWDDPDRIYTSSSEVHHGRDSYQDQIRDSRASTFGNANNMARQEVDFKKYQFDVKRGIGQTFDNMASTFRGRGGDAYARTAQEFKAFNANLDVSKQQLNNFDLPADIYRAYVQLIQNKNQEFHTFANNLDANNLTRLNAEIFNINKTIEKGGIILKTQQDINDGTILYDKLEGHSKRHFSSQADLKQAIDGHAGMVERYFRGQLSESAKATFDGHYRTVQNIRLSRPGLECIKIDDKTVKDALKSSKKMVVKHYLPFVKDRVQRLNKDIQTFNELRVQVRNKLIRPTGNLGLSQAIEDQMWTEVTNLDDWARAARPNALKNWGKKTSEGKKPSEGLRETCEQTFERVNTRLTEINDALGKYQKLPNNDRQKRIFESEVLNKLFFPKPDEVSNKDVLAATQAGVDAFKAPHNPFKVMKAGFKIGKLWKILSKDDGAGSAPFYQGPSPWDGIEETTQTRP